MRRHHGTVVLVALALILAACGPGTTSRIPRTPITAAPTTGAPSTTAGATTTAPPAQTVDVRVYFLHGETIDVAHREVPATPRVAAAAMMELLAGPTEADRAAGLSSAVPTGTRLRSVEVASGTATVDLSGQFASGGGSLSMTARLAQVTFTLTQFPTVSRVVFELDGAPVTVFGGEGIVLDHPSTRASFEALAPAILVEFPGRGWAVESPIEISGSADVFEAQFRVELTDAGGSVLAARAVMATAGTGTRGTFSLSVPYALATAGPGTLTVFDLSPKDGSRIDVVQIPLQLAQS